MKKRRIGRILALTMGLAMIAAACGSTDSDETTATQEATKADSETSEPPPLSTAASEPEATGTTQENPSCVNALPSGQTKIDTTAGGHEYSSNVYIPESEPTAGLLPVVIAFHGLTWDAARMAAYDGLEVLAEEEQFAVVHPNGLLTTDGPMLLTFGRNWELPPFFDEEGRDDVAFVETLVSQLVDEWCIDPDRVYLVGDANGALLTSILVCELSDLVAAAFASGGILPPPDCDPVRSVPFMALHGADNTNIPFEPNTPGDFAEVPGINEAFAPGVRAYFEQLTALANCGPEPTESSFSATAIRFDYNDCEADMSLVVVDGLGSYWPGEAEDTTSGLNGADITWDFLSQYRLDS